MNIETFIEYCLSKPFVEEIFPFDDITLVLKVAGKMFALIPLDCDFKVNLKAEPEQVIELQEKYNEIEPGFHMNKKHWITVNVRGRITDQLLQQLTDQSYKLVFDSLPKRLKAELNGG